MMRKESLKRTLSMPLVLFYGLGTTIGAGVFALLGKIAGRAGMYAPVSFIVASLLAAFTALTFAELVARYPHSAGEAVYVREGTGLRPLAMVVGLMVAAAGIVSAAAILNASVGYIQYFLTLDRNTVIITLGAGLCILAGWGILQSVKIAALLTLIEIGGLCLVVWVGFDGLATLPERTAELIPPAEGAAMLAIFSGAFLAFYAFLGFEDMVNVAEEVKGVRRALPMAIIMTLVITTILYVVVALTAVLNVPPDELYESDAPISLLYQRATGEDATVITMISIFAMLNGALIQIIMASRVLYGLGNQALIHRIFAQVNSATQTPLFATMVVGLLLLTLALWQTLEPLAEATSFLTLLVFSLVNLSLIRIKLRNPNPVGITTYPLWVPVVGSLVSILFLALRAKDLMGF